MTPAHGIIPDIHADLARLEASLAMLAGARPVFLGDFIDAKPKENESYGTVSGKAADREVLTRVRSLIDSGAALAIMGNHELNAILFHRRGADGQPLRQRSPENRHQHKSFLASLGEETPEALQWTDWFLTLPLWHEGDGFRLVHAFWSDDDIALIRARRPDARLRPEDLPEIATESTAFGRAVKRITSGPEVRLPDGITYRDGGGKLRDMGRLCWWRRGATWRQALLSVPQPSTLPDTALPEDIGTLTYPLDAAPVFVGHYKMAEEPRIEAPRAMCLDYPDAPCIYLWHGETDLDPAHLQQIPGHKLRLAGNPLISTGYGTFIVTLTLRTRREHAPAMQAAMELTPQFRPEAPDHAFYLWHPTATRRGDDETLAHMLSLFKPEDVHVSILWEESRY